MRILLFTLLLFSLVPRVQAAEITTCIIDTSNKNNPVFYYYPIAATELKCDHDRGRTMTLNDLYGDNWRLVQIMSPVLFENKDIQSAYTPPVLYLEREHAPVKIKKDKREKTGAASLTEESSDDELDDSDNLPAGGGLFNWLKGDSTEE